jgi:hypothetical protein
LGLQLHLLDDANLGTQLPRFLHLSHVGLYLPGQETFRSGEVATRDHPKKLIRSIYELSVGIFNPLELWRNIWNSRQRVIVVRQDPLFFTFHTLSQRFDALDCILGSFCVGI